MKILVLGASGMIGHTVFRILKEKINLEVWGTIRPQFDRKLFDVRLQKHLVSDIDIENFDTILKLFYDVLPDVVINCVGLTKHKSGSDDALTTIPINSILPHRLAALCKLINARLIHISTDCVFSGTTGNYVEDDLPDALDIYGKSKSLGEVIYPNTITIRTSTIGHEIKGSYGLLDWFLSQKESCQGFSKAIFSGLPTIVLAQILRDVIIPNKKLFGLYHVASNAIDKLSLLQLIAYEYKKSIEIIPNDKFIIDRSLDATRFRLATGYVPPAWPELIKVMYAYR